MRGLRMRWLAGAAAGFGCAAAAGLVMAGGAQGGAVGIDVTDNQFTPDPSNVSLNQAEYTWTWGATAAPHNVRQDTKLFRSGPTTDVPGTTFGPIELPAGRYHYYCELHGSESGGMDGEIRVSPDADAVDPEFEVIRWANDTAIRFGDRWHVQFRKGELKTGPWRTWKKSTGALSGKFGKNDSPVNYNPEKTYQVRVKTMDSDRPTRRSKFSPTLVFGLVP